MSGSSAEHEIKQTQCRQHEFHLSSRLFSGGDEGNNFDCSWHITSAFLNLLCDIEENFVIFGYSLARFLYTF